MYRAQRPTTARVVQAPGSRHSAEPNDGSGDASAALSSRAAVMDAPSPVWSVKRRGLFTGHRGSSLAERPRKTPVKAKESRTMGSGNFLVTFCLHKK